MSLPLPHIALAGFAYSSKMMNLSNSSTPPFVEHFVESFTRFTVYGMMDLFTRYNQCPLHLGSKDLMTFNSPMGSYHLTTVPMEYMNAVQIYQADMSFILQDKIPCFTYPFIDDLPVKSVTTCYQHSDSLYKTIPDNQGI